MGTTYTGLAGRIIGVTWGVFWFGVGAVASTIIGDNFDVLPDVAKQNISEFVPVMLTLAETGESSIAVGLFFGLFAAIGLVYGTYEMVRAFTEAEYSITFNSRHG